MTAAEDEKPSKFGLRPAARLDSPQGAIPGARPGIARAFAVHKRENRSTTNYIDDLRFAHAASLTVDVTLFNGRTFFAGVKAIDEGFGSVTLYAPMTFGDSAAETIALSDIVSVAVTQIEWHPPNELG